MRFRFFDKDPTVEFIIELLKNAPVMIEMFEDLEQMIDDEVDEFLEFWK